MKNRTSIYQALQIKAIFGMLNKTDIYFFRKICRWYSEKFNTPLHEVMKGDIITWDEVLLHYYESQFEEIGYNNVYELACEEYIPELADHREQENIEFAKALEEEQKETLKRKKEKKSLKNPPPQMRLNFEDEEID